MKTSSKQILRFVVAIWILIAASLACNTSTSPTITQVVQVTQVVTTLADGTVATSIPLAPTADIPAASVPSPTERPDIQILADGVQVTALTFSPEGNFLAAGYENALHIWDVIAGQEIRTFQTSGTITDIAFRDNNTVVASIFPAEINTYSIGFGEMLEGLTDTGYYEKTAFSEDGNHLAVLNNTNNDIIFFDVPGKEYLKVIDNNEFGYSMALSTNNNVLAYGQSDSNKIVLVNTTTWKEIYSFDGPGHSMTISRDRPLLAYSTDDSISIVNVSTGQRLHTMVLGDWTFSMDISNDGTLLASSPANSVGITIWDVATGQVIRTLPDVNFVKVAFSPDNRLLASGDSFEKGTLRIFNLPGLGIEAPSSFTMPTPTGGGTGKIFFCGTRETGGGYQLYQMNADGTGVTKFQPTLKNVCDPSWSPDGTRFAYASSGYIYISNLDGSEQNLLTGRSDSMYAWHPVWSPDGTKIAFSFGSDDNYQIYTMNIDAPSSTAITNSNSNNVAPSWSPDSKKIAFISNRDGHDEIYVMNVDGSAQTRITNLSGNAWGVDDVAWSPLGNQLAFTYDGYIYVMNVDGSELTQLTDSAGAVEIGWSPDGTTIVFHVVGGGIRTINYQGTELKILTDQEDDFSPVWQP